MHEKRKALEIPTKSLEDCGLGREFCDRDKFFGTEEFLNIDFLSLPLGILPEVGRRCPEGRDDLDPAETSLSGTNRLHKVFLGLKRAGCKRCRTEDLGRAQEHDSLGDQIIRRRL